MSESDESTGRAQDALKHLRDVDGRSDLVDRLGAFVPGSSGDDWLSPGDQGFSDAFGQEPGARGLFDAQQYAEFWGYCREYDGDQDLAPLAGFLERVLAGWDTAAREQPPAAADTEGAPRYIEIAPVPGYPEWWQSYDVLDEQWRYARSATAPDPGTADWVDYSTAFPETEDPVLPGSGGPAEDAGQARPVDPGTASQTVFDRVMSELTEPDEDAEVPPEVTEQERTELWNQVWAEVHQAAADWGRSQEDRIVDTVVQAYLQRLEQQDDSADLLLAEIQSFIDLLADSSPH
jgi:hypothetical protein